MKKISKILLVALISFGWVALMPVVNADNSETCWGRCNTLRVQDDVLHSWWSIVGADDDAQPVQDEALQRWWHVAGTDDMKPVQDESVQRWWHAAGADDTEATQAALQRWWNVAGADDTEAAEDSERYSWHDPADQERNTMASYR